MGESTECLGYVSIERLVLIWIFSWLIHMRRWVYRLVVKVRPISLNKLGCRSCVLPILWWHVVFPLFCKSITGDMYVHGSAIWIIARGDGMSIWAERITSVIAGALCGLVAVHNSRSTRICDKFIARVERAGPFGQAPLDKWAFHNPDR